MKPSRRTVMTAGLGVGLTTAAGASAIAGRFGTARESNAVSQVHAGAWADLGVNSVQDHSARLQDLIDSHAQNGLPLYLPPGIIRVANIILRPGTTLIGAEGLTYLHYVGGKSFISGVSSADITLKGLGFDGQNLGLNARNAKALIALDTCTNIHIENCRIRHSLLNGIVLQDCSGRIQNTTIEDVRLTGLFANDSRDLDIVHNHVRRCGDNAIQVWRSTSGSDETRISSNRIQHIAAKSGGSGQYGNGINVFRADNVSVSDNHISDCAYSAVRGNAASNLQIIANSCARIGEVALYAEFEFEGAMIANNLVSDAATGISVTNFKQGGRLATITGNLIRDLKRRAFEPVDKRGVGISVEADSVVSNNTIENAATAGVVLGWGPYRRDLLTSQNIIRNANIGILVSADPEGGPTLVTSNMITGSTQGAIRKARLDTPFGPHLENGTKTTAGLTISQNVMKDAAG